MGERTSETTEEEIIHSIGHNPIVALSSCLTFNETSEYLVSSPPNDKVSAL
jgi:hypothetical protein